MNRFPAAQWAMALLLSVIGVSSAQAHFPWLDVDAEGRALLFFGESFLERTYSLPEAILKAEVNARDGEEISANLPLETVDEDEFVGRRSTKPVAKDAILEMTVRYGIYHGMLLDYFAKHLPGDDPAAWKGEAASKSLKFDAVPKIDGEKLQIAVTWEGKPKADVAVMMTDAEGDLHEETTGEDGVAAFEKVAKGPVGVVFNFTDKEAQGEADGKKYTSAGYYGTLSFHNGKAESEVAAPKAAKAAAAEADTSASDYPKLSEPVSSFGGAVCDGYLYVYSGHTGREHEHSRENLSQTFQRIKLDGGAAWEELPMQTPLQGLPLVAHKGKLYRVGGLSARNAPDEDEDMHSVAEFAMFDPQTMKWTELPSLPEGRSSHDAVVIGDVLYVVGGWTLSGDRKGKWLDTAWAFDLSKPDAKWTPLPQPNFRRRALAAAQWNGQLVALGGMNEEADISREVNVLDFATGKWAKLADMPGEEGMDGFGVSAWNLDGRLFASGTQDSVYCLADDGRSWAAAGALKTPRFFHRLLAADESTLLAVAGASMDGHLGSIERMTPGVQQ